MSDYPEIREYGKDVTEGQVIRAAAVDELRSGYRESDEPLTDRACVRCAHHTTAGEVGALHLCQRPQFGSKFDHVVGCEVPNTKSAYDERSTGGPDACGPEGKFWSQSGF